MPTSKFYRILNTKSGRYREGGVRGGIGGTFSKSGKLWKRIGDVKSHLRQGLDNLKRLRMNALKWAQYIDALNEAEVRAKTVEDQVLIEYELLEVKRTPLKDILEEMKDVSS